MGCANTQSTPKNHDEKVSMTHDTDRINRLEYLVDSTPRIRINKPVIIQLVVRKPDTVSIRGKVLSVLPKIGIQN